MAQGRKAGRAYVELGVDDKLTKGLDVASQKLKAFGDGIRDIGVKLAAIGGAGAGGLLAASKVFADVGSQVYDMSKRTGLSAEAISELGYVAGQAGVEMGTLEGGVKKMQKALGDATFGSAEALKAFDDLGLSVSELIGMSPERAFTMIGDRIASIQSPTLRAAAAMKIFGKSGADLLPMLDGGADALSKARMEARDLGLTLSTESVTAADALGDAYGRLGATVKALAYNIGAQLAPELTDVANATARTISGAIAWVKENRTAVTTAMKLSLAIGSVGAALIAIGGAMSLAGMAFAGLSSAIAAVASIGGTVATVLAAIGAPITTLALGLGTAASLFLHFSGALEAASAAAGNISKSLGDDFDTTLEGITMALQRGDVESATKIMMLGVKSAMQTVLGEMESAWKKFTDGLAETTPVWGTTIGQLWEEAKGEAKAKWFEASGQLHGFNNMVNAWSLGGTLKGANALGMGVAGSGEALDRYFKRQALEQWAGFNAKAMKARSDALKASDAVVNDTVNNATEVGQQLIAMGDETNHALKTIADEIESERKKLRDSVDSERWMRDHTAPDRAARGQTPRLWKPWCDTQGNGWQQSEGGSVADRIEQSLTDLVSAVPEAITRISSGSIFNPSAIQSLQVASSTPLTRIAKATEKTADKTAQLVDMARQQGGLVFQE